MFIARELCDDKRLATVDGTGSNRRRPVLSMCAVQSGLEYSGLNSDASEASLNNSFRMQTIKVVEKNCTAMASNMNAE